MLLALVQMMTMEYFVGLELLRPFILYLLVSPQVKGFGRRAVKTLQRWAPYLVVMAAFALWRLFLMPTPGRDRNTPTLLLDLVQKPLNTLVYFLQAALQDSVQILVATWYKTLEPALFTLTRPANLLSWVVVVLVALALYLLSIGLNCQGDANGWPHMRLGGRCAAVRALSGWSSAAWSTCSTAVQTASPFRLFAQPVAGSSVDLLVQNLTYQTIFLCLWWVGVGATAHRLRFPQGLDQADAYSPACLARS